METKTNFVRNFVRNKACEGLGMNCIRIRIRKMLYVGPYYDCPPHILYDILTFPMFYFQ